MSPTQRPYFLWDYNLTENDILRILHGDNRVEKGWILSRLLESAKFEDVWKYTTLAEVKEMFPYLKLKEPIKQAWERAINVWGTA